MAVIQNMVNPKYAPQGKQRAEDGVKSEGRSVMERIELKFAPFKIWGIPKGS
ncbi:hypothetical protein FACS1894163_00020 [Spirochaetia bacterium]|nr:hypothetical protein FACS1894163_00020 [Spirochaetia bacterium]